MCGAGRAAGGAVARGAAGGAAAGAGGAAAGGTTGRAAGGEAGGAVADGFRRIAAVLMVCGTVTTGRVGDV